MNPCLAQMKAGDREKSHPQAPSKPSKPGFEGFEGDRSRCLSQIGLTSTGAGEAPFARTTNPYLTKLRVLDDTAYRLGWTANDLFGLHTPPENPHPTYRRLSRYDETGLIWLLNGSEVLALTAMTATIRRPSGSTTTYRKRNTPTPIAPDDGLDGLR
jgi:hypothetical protein